MASAGAGYYGSDLSGYYGYGYPSRQQPAPVSSAATSFHLCLFLATASLLGAALLYSRCESAVEGHVDQLRVALVLSPLLLLLAAQYWFATGRRWRSSYSSSSSLLVAPPVVSGEHPPWYEQPQQQDGAGSSPWGVALALAVVLLLVSYQSCFQDLWFPVVSRRRRSRR